MSEQTHKKPVFQLNNIDLYYGDFQAIKNVNMTINYHEVTAFKIGRAHV